MKIKVVVNRSVIDKLWALGASGPARAMADTEGVLELDERVVLHAIDLFDGPTFSAALERLIDAKLFEPPSEKGA